MVGGEEAECGFELVPAPARATNRLHYATPRCIHEPTGRPSLHQSLARDAVVFFLLAPIHQVSASLPVRAYLGHAVTES